jgi:hypothetical protein
MSIKTKKHLTFVADVLEGSLKEVFSFGGWTARIVCANIMERKPRKPRISRRQPRTRRIIYREAVYRQAAPRVVYLRAR